MSKTAVAKFTVAVVTLLHIFSDTNTFELTNSDTEDASGPDYGQIAIKNDNDEEDVDIL